jgi:hypothetical protein
MAATIRFWLFLIYEAAKKTASILFVPQMKHDGNGSRNQEERSAPESTVGA